MKEKMTKTIDEKHIKIGSIWAIIIFCIWPLLMCVTPGIVEFIIKQDIFIDYYRNFTFQLLLYIGGIICVTGFVFTEFIYYFKVKKYKVAIICIVIIGCVFCISYKFIPESNICRYYKDFNYVSQGNYYEEVQNLDKVYAKNVSGAKGNHYTQIYVKTTDFEFRIYDDIVKEKDYAEFHAKFSKVKKVKIGYLPNSKTLLYIEPADDKNPRK